MMARATGQSKAALCPKCAQLIDGWGTHGHDTSPPRPDDVTVCSYCYTTLVFDADMMPRLPTMAEVMEIAGDEALSSMLGQMTNRLKTVRATAGKRGF
jgi:hypothetical protein